MWMHYMATAEKNPVHVPNMGFDFMEILSTSDGAKVGVRVHPPALLFVEQDIKKSSSVSGFMHLFLFFIFHSIICAKCDYIKPLC